MKNILITQSNYIPWKGYFDGINSCDVFVVYDDMQYTKRDWRNRNKIKTPQGSKWLTIPVEVKGKYYQRINETLISDPEWNIDHWNNLKQNYSKSRCFADVKDMIESWYMDAKQQRLTDINVHFLQRICEFLNISTEWRSSTEFDLAEDKTQRLVDICSNLDGTHYYSGPAAKSYMEEHKFADKNISVRYFDYSGYPEYEQLYPPFDHGVSILDLIFNEGDNASQFLKHSKEA
jgi:hypothetical protein